MTEPTVSNGDIAASIATLSAALNEQTASIDNLDGSIRSETQARNAKVDAINRFSKLAVALMILVLLAIGGVTYVLIKQNNEAKDRAAAAQAQRTQQQVDTQKVLEAIQGCTQPGGLCFRANRDDTAKALDLLQQYEYVVGICSVQHPNDVPGYKSCVISYKVPGAPTTVPLPK